MPENTGRNRPAGLSPDDVNQLSHRLSQFALHLTKSKADAEDLVQDTLLHAHRKFDRWEPGTNLGAWVSTLMFNIFRTQWAHTRRRRQLAPLDDITVSAWLEPSQEASLSLNRVWKTLPQLSPIHRDVLHLALGGAKYDEIAVALDLPIGTVRSRLARARNHLRTEARVG